MRYCALCLALLEAIFIGFCYATPLITNEAAARQFVDKASQRLDSYYNSLSRDALIARKKDRDMAMRDFNLGQTLVAIVNDSRAFDHTNFRDKELKYIFDLLRRCAGPIVAGEEPYLDLIDAQITLYAISSHRDIELYRSDSVRVAYFPDIQNIIAASNDPAELKYYWSAWRRKNDFWAKRNFEIMAESLMFAANMTGELFDRLKWA